MNAGANQWTISKSLVKLYIYDCVEENGWRWSSKEDFTFGYRCSDIGSRIIYKAILKTYPCDVDKLGDLYRGFMGKRRSAQPLSRPSAGSVFKNGENYYAGEVIERCGCKGWRVGDAAVSRKHANFIVNMGRARARDILDLIDRIKSRVYEKEGIELELEIELVGF